MLTSKLQVEKYVFMGLIYGYNECCIKYFHLRQVNGDMQQYVEDKYHNGESEEDKVKLSGTGFVCCPSCDAEYTQEEIIEKINRKRVLSAKFSPKIENNKFIKITEEDILQVSGRKTLKFINEVIKEVEIYTKLN